jgi:hypothetical protein
MKAQQTLTEQYNYDSFTRSNFEPWMRFDSSPPIGQQAPDFPLWRLEDRGETRLSEIWAEYRFLVVEFGSFT